MTKHQQPRELSRFIDILKERGVKTYLEIGAKHGDTFREIIEALGAFGVAVDLPNGPWGGNSRANLIKVCREVGGVAVFGDSSDPSIIREVRAYGPFDAVLIDADHRYEAVKKDFEHYHAPITAFHDIDGEGISLRGMPIGVPKLWAEIKAQCEHEEIIDPSDDRRMGIGVLYGVHRRVG